ncbi:hypothetical protein [Sphingobacterium bambusae]|uniref:Uncharacterized protein n=1 Tax=Sphingobacterium bambusae TaxID=662858 RepID=A0ABW6BL00_9SPHI|nr:hypothetical protein [Sphingobacterium bambusae]WPL48062.1 hypothetical protein SCB77_19100 [Sphingobacterium bambusae]
MTNRNPTKDSGLYMEMPAQESKRCSFLNKESRRQPKFTVGPKYATDFEKYGLIPNITNDTLKIIGNKILFFKKGEDRSIGFVFK